MSSQQPFWLGQRVLVTGGAGFIGSNRWDRLLAVEQLQARPLLGSFNLGHDRRVTIREIAKTVIAISGKDIPGEWDTARPTAIWGQALDCSLATRLLGGWAAQVALRVGRERTDASIAARLQAGEADA
ncbi:MAG: hypothetical protein IT317_07955 [Anaerolineales bacterium]|nr:hypothetical protein [Anaerolineales bacterium]